MKILEALTLIPFSIATSLDPRFRLLLSEKQIEFAILAKLCELKQARKSVAKGEGRATT